MNVKLIIISLLLSGCTSLDEADKAWFVMHAVDVAQTYQIAKNPRCYAEGNAITKELIGAHPSGEEAVLWGLATAAIYYAASDHIPKWLKLTAVSGKSFTVTRNASHGLGLTSSGCERYVGNRDVEMFQHEIYF